MSEQNQNSGVSRAAALAEELLAQTGKLKRRLREQANSGDLTPAQTAVLVRLERHGPATVSSLARAEAMRPQSMGTTVALLEAAGLVHGQPDPADGRQTILSLTENCRLWIKDARATWQEWLVRKIEARLSPQEQDDLARALKLLQRLADD